MKDKSQTSFNELLTEVRNSRKIADVFSEKNIEHAGVKGMRWGVIRSRSAKYAAKAEARNIKKGKADLKSMSDDDLRKAINRIQMERQYTQMTTKPSLFSKGAKMASGILENLAKESAKAIAKSYVTPLVEKAMLNKTGGKPGSASSTIIRPSRPPSGFPKPDSMRAPLPPLRALPPPKPK